jgi:SAM-dependent methyltransferase
MFKPNQQTKAFVRSLYEHLASVPPIPKLITAVNKIRHKRDRVRCLEIGPGSKRLPNFETLNIVPGLSVDYIADAGKGLPFPDETFDIIYASHILEHIPWFQTLRALEEWVRALKISGSLEVWVPDGLKICETLLRFEREGINQIDRDGWYKFNPERDPCKWAAGRLYTYGDGTGRLAHPNWHRSLLTPRYLKRLLEQAGLSDILQMAPEEVRGYDHGWINLGFRGIKRRGRSENGDGLARLRSAPAQAGVALTTH